MFNKGLGGGWHSVTSIPVTSMSVASFSVTGLAGRLYVTSISVTSFSIAGLSQYVTLWLK